MALCIKSNYARLFKKQEGFGAVGGWERRQIRNTEEDEPIYIRKA